MDKFHIFPEYISVFIMDMPPCQEPEQFSGPLNAGGKSFLPLPKELADAVAIILEGVPDPLQHCYAPACCRKAGIHSFPQPDHVEAGCGNSNLGDLLGQSCESEVA